MRSRAKLLFKLDKLQKVEAPLEALGTSIVETIISYPSESKISNYIIELNPSFNKSGKRLFELYTYVRSLVATFNPMDYGKRFETQQGCDETLL